MGRLARAGLLIAAVMLVMIGLAIGSTNSADRREGEPDAGASDGPVGVPAEVVEPTASPSPRAVRATPGPLATFTVRYDLDRGLTAPIWDADRLLPLHPAVRDGRVRAIRRDVGLAAAYPGPCAVKPASACPRAILESDRAGWLNPRSRDVRWGALVLLRREQTSDGENVVQKGRSTAGTQFKLQVDHIAGLPSCVVAGPVLGVNRIFIAKYDKSVADGSWHSLDCRRAAGTLTLLVDGVVVRRVVVPAELSIANDEPLRLGGKGINPDNDQFHGRLDNVYVTIG